MSGFEVLEVRWIISCNRLFGLYLCELDRVLVGKSDSLGE